MNHKSKSEMENLNFLLEIGIHKGVMMATGNSPEIKINGTDKYEWVSNKRFILHTVDVIIGDETMQAIEVIGFDEKLKKYPMQSFDSAGEITLMNGNFDNQSAFLLIGENAGNINSKRQPI